MIKDPLNMSEQEDELSQEEKLRQSANLLDQISNFKVPLKNNAPAYEPVLDPNLTANQLQDQADAPLFVAPELLRQAELNGESVNFNDPVINPSPIPETPVTKPTNRPSGNLPGGDGGSSSDPISKYEALLEDYRRRMDSSFQDPSIAEARKKDDIFRLVGIAGDAIAKASQGASQKRLGIPGVSIADAGMSELASGLAVNEKRATEDRKLKQEQLLKELEAVQQAARLEQQNQINKQRLEMQQAMEEGRDRRFVEALNQRAGQFDYKKDLDKRISDKQLDALDAYNQTLSSFSRIKELKKNIDTGPLASIRNTAAKSIGIDDPNVTALKAEILDSLAAKIKQMSGTASSEPEQKRLAITLPSMQDNDAVFERLLKQAEERVKEAYEIRKQNYQKQGKNVSNFEEPIKTATTVNELSPKDQQALDWANKNPNDPRAQKIKTKLGM